MMIYGYFIIAFAIVVALGPWLWRYQLKPRYATQTYTRLLQQHPHQAQIEKTVHFLHSLYKKINSAAISRQERKRYALMDDAYVYGEIDFLSFIFILEKAKPRSGEIFYDLGSGAGKAVFTAALSYDFYKVYGIERLPGLYKLAQIQVNKAITLANLNKIKNHMQRIKAIQFINGDFIEQNIVKADIVFINATCLSYHIWEALVEKLMQLKQGSRVIVTTKKIQNKQFTLLYHGLELMSWGINSVSIYLKV